MQYVFYDDNKTMQKLHAIKLHLTPDEILRLANGKTIHVSHSKLFKGIEVVVKKKKANKAVRAHEAQRGIRMNLDPEELEAQGGSFWDTLKNAGNFIREKIFKSPIYKENIAPLIKQGLEKGVDALSVAVGAKAPFLTPVIQSVGRAGVSKLGEVSGAYGLPKRRGRRGVGGAMIIGSSYEQGSAFNPALPLPDFSKPTYRRMERGSAEAMEWGAKMKALKQRRNESRQAQGGSFVPAGRY